MKKLQYIISAILLVFVLSSCNKEDYIRPIPFNFENEETESANYLVVNGDTCQFTQVAKVRWSNNDFSSDMFSTESLAKSSTYLFYIGQEVVLNLENVSLTCNGGDTIHANSMTTVTSQHFANMLNFDLSVYQKGDIYDIRMCGVTVNGDSIKMHYSDTVIDLNKTTGEGTLLITDHTYMPSFNQLTLNKDNAGNYSFMICDPTDSITYWNARVEIRPVLTSGMYEIPVSEVDVIIWTGANLHDNAYHPFGELQAHPLTNGNLQFSEREGIYRIICHGTCDLGEVHFQFDGTCTNTESFPTTLPCWYK